MKYTKAQIDSVLSDEEKKGSLFEVECKRKGWFSRETALEAYERVIGERLVAKEKRDLRIMAHKAIIATGAADPLAAIEQLIEEHHKMRDAIYMNAPPRPRSIGGLPCPSPERTEYFAKYGIAEHFWGFCCNG